MAEDMPEYRDMLKKSIQRSEKGVEVCSKLKKSLDEIEGQLEPRDKHKVDDEEVVAFDKKLSLKDVSYRRPQRHSTEQSESQIIASLGGGDMTGGSCGSLALAYVGNVAGYNVLDFRGGKSWEYFRSGSTLETICDLSGVESIRGGDNLAGAQKLLDDMPSGKQYVLRAASHAAIVKKENGKTYYLELQSATDNGWHELDNTQLRERFGYWKFGDTSLKLPSKLIDVESLAQNETFIEMLGYLNTADSEQKKGASGSVK